MKTRYILTCIAALLAFYACNDTKEEVEINGTQLVLTAYQEGSADSKTAVEDGGKQVFWEPGDEIKVFSGSHSGKFTSSAESLEAVTTFTGHLEGMGPDVADIWAIYPYRDEASFDGETITTVIPSVQTARPGTFAQGANVSIAHSATTSLRFYNVAGGVRFSVSRDDIKSVTFCGNAGETLAGRITVHMEGDGNPRIGSVENTVTAVSVTPENGETFKAGKYYFISMVPASLSQGFSMTFEIAKGTSRTKTTSNAVNIKRSTWGTITDADKDLSFDDPETGSDDVLNYAEEVVTIVAQDTPGEVSVVDDSELTLSEEVVSSNGIAEGTVIVIQTGSSSKDLFIGKVVSTIGNGDGTVTVHTEMPSVEEVFQDLEITPVMDRTNTLAEAIPDEGDNAVFTGLVDNSIWDELTVVHTERRRMTKAERDDNEEAAIDLTLSFEMKPNEALSGSIYIRIKGAVTLREDKTFILNADISVGVRGEFHLSDEEPAVFTKVALLKLANPIMLYSNKIVTVTFDPSLNFFVEGSVALDADMQYEILSSKIVATYANGVFNAGAAEKKRKSYFRVERFKLYGAYGFSLDSDFNAYILARDFLSAGAEIESGVKISLEGDASYVYVEFPGLFAFDVKMGFTPYVGVTPYFTAVGNKFEGDTFEKEFSSWSLSLVPEFKQIDYTTSETAVEGQEDLSVSVDVDPELTGSFVETQEDGIALFELGEDDPIEMAPVVEDNNSRSASGPKVLSEEVNFKLDTEKKYEIARYSKTLDNTIVYDKKIPIDSDLREYLIHLYETAGGKNWTHQDNWCSDLPVEEWYGVYYNDYDGFYELSLGSNNLSGLVDFSGCPYRLDLRMGTNNISAVNLTDCPLLFRADFRDNLLASVNITDCESLSYLYVDNKTRYDDQTGEEILADITSFRLFNCPELSSLTVSHGNMENWSVNLTGFPKLKDLDISGNRLDRLNVSRCDSLRTLNCVGNKISRLNLSGKEFLEHLEARGNGMTTLDISGCDKLREVNVADNSLTSFDISNRKYLEGLYLAANPLKSINASGCENLRTLDASYSGELINKSEFVIEEVNLSGCKNLYDAIYLSSGTNIVRLDISGCEALSVLMIPIMFTQSINASGSGLCDIRLMTNRQVPDFTSLDLSGCSSLRELVIDDCNLDNLDLSDCMELREIDIRAMKITELNLRNNKNLDRLKFHGGLRNLYLTGLTNLWEIDVSYNQLTELDLTGLTNLREIDISGNPLKTLIVDGCSNLDGIECSSGMLEYFSAKDCPALTEVDLSNNKLTRLDLDGSGNIDRLDIYRNRLTGLVTQFKAKHIHYSAKYGYESRVVNGEKRWVAIEYPYGLWTEKEPLYPVVGTGADGEEPQITYPDYWE